MASQFGCIAPSLWPRKDPCRSCPPRMVVFKRRTPHRWRADRVPMSRRNDPVAPRANRASAIFSGSSAARFVPVSAPASPIKPSTTTCATWRPFGQKLPGEGLHETAQRKLRAAEGEPAAPRAHSEVAPVKSITPSPASIISFAVSRAQTNSIGRVRGSGLRILTYPRTCAPSS